VSEKDAFVNAIIDSPEDDTPRLIFADWLDENGEPERAEFVRAQVDYHRRWSVPRWKRRHDGHILARKSETCRCRLCVLWHRWGTLLSRNKYVWLHGFLGPGWEARGSGFPGAVEFVNGAGRVGPMMPLFDRGFVGHVALSAADAVAHLDAVLAGQPVTEVTLPGLPMDGPAVSRRIMTAEITSHGTPRGMRSWVVAGRAVTVPFAATWSDILSARWPTVRTWHLPPDPIRSAWNRPHPLPDSVAYETTMMGDTRLCTW
jgi:uncharacterized protein (TIGR02996 family)